MKTTVSEIIIEQKVLSLQRAREIMDEEGIQYTNEELQYVIDFITQLVVISADHYARVKEYKTKIISLNLNQAHETKSIPIHPRKHRRAG